MSYESGLLFSLISFLALFYSLLALAFPDLCPSVTTYYNNTLNENVTEMENIGFWDRFKMIWTYTTNFECSMPIIMISAIITIPCFLAIIYIGARLVRGGG